MQRRAGFTIVELLIVIVIIGILAVTAVNSFRDVQRNARNRQTFHLPVPTVKRSSITP